MEFAKKLETEKNFFVVYSLENMPIYLAYSEEKFGKRKYTLVDMAANEIAVIILKKKHCITEYESNTHELKYNELFDKPKFTLNNNNFNIK